MARTNTQRYDDTIKYIHKNIDSGLALAVAAASHHLTSDQLGAAITLGNFGYWKGGTANQHWAVRALLLCQKVFLNGPYSKGSNGNDFSYNFLPNLPKTFYKEKTEDEVKQGLRAYLTLPASRVDVATAATSIRAPSGGTTWETLQRTTDPFPNMPVCFDALKMWLFKAGFVSIPWLAKTGPTMTAQTVNTILGNGEVIEERRLNAIPRGYLFNFHKEGDKAVCHWGVSLGEGWAAGSNTSADWPGAAAPVTFRYGGSAYGEFTLASALEVCKAKYGALNARANVTIRQIDPEAVATYF